MKLVRNTFARAIALWMDERTHMKNWSGHSFGVTFYAEPRGANHLLDQPKGVD